MDKHKANEHFTDALLTAVEYAEFLGLTPAQVIRQFADAYRQVAKTNAEAVATKYDQAWQAIHY